MRPFITVLAAAALLLQLFPVPASSADQTLIAPSSLWKFNDKGTNLGTSWRSTSYNDSTWSQGNAQLGYGDGDESTVLGFGSSSNRYITYYFRKTFTVSNLASISALTLRYIRDDGCVIYVNGVEVVRSNMPTGTISYTTRAVTAVAVPQESEWLQAQLDKSLLVNGTNVIAVEVHQQAPTSTDVSFNLELLATAQNTAPQVSLVSPAHQSTSNSGSLTFNATLTAPAGLSSATLLLSSAPVTVTFSGAAQIEDTQITADTPTVPNGSAAAVNVDGQSPHAHGLLRAASMIGGGAGQVPAGSVIQSAALLLNCTNPGNLMQLYRLTESWLEDQATWNERQIGLPWTNPGADGAGSNAQSATPGDCTATGVRSIDITNFVQQWSNGSPNYGLLLTDSGTDGIDFDSSESPASPQISVVYQPAAQTGGTQSVSGTSAPVSFNANLPVGTYFWNVRVTDTQGQQSTAGSDFQITVDAASPNSPTLISPASGVTGVPVSTALQVAVSNPAGGTLNVNFQLRQPPAAEFTIIALPDTQNYSEFYPDIFTSQTQWIAAQQATRNIVFVTQEGDLVNHANSTTEYDRANTSMSILDGVVPYGIAPGNHDEPTTLFNQYFPFTRYLPFYWYGGHYLNLNDNNYQLFSAGGMDFVIVHLDFCPAASAVTWAGSILKQYPNRIGMMTTHGYLDASANRSVSGCTSTQYLWDGLAVPNPNLHFMFSAHVHPNGEARRADMVNGHPVHQIMSDYQDRAQGGEGWLRIMRFVPAENKIYVQTYSPWLNQYETDANSQFTLDFAMGGQFSSVGSVSVPSGSSAAVPLTGLNADQLYEWRAVVTNANGKSVTGPSWTFRTAANAPPPPVNQAPTANSAAYNTASATPVAISLTGSDPESDPLTYSIVGAPVGGSLSGTSPQVTYTPNAGFSGAGSFSFRVNDGTSFSNTATISVTVAAPVNQAPTANSAAYNTASATPVAISLTGSDPESDPLTYSIVGSPVGGSLSGAPPQVTYTPNAGFSGAGSFSFRVNDGTLFSNTATVNVTVAEPPPPPPPPPPAEPVTIFTANFTTGQDSFTYLDNTFLGTTQSSYASGSRVSSGGYSGGALRVLLGGINNNTITGMSGGWRRTFTLSTAGTLTLSFRYNLSQGGDYESDEFSQILASVNGALVGSGGVVAQVAGDGEGGPAIGTGWQLFTVDIPLAAGTHTVVLGGYNNKKTTTSESTTILIDNVSATLLP